MPKKSKEMINKTNYNNSEIIFDKLVATIHFAIVTKRTKTATTISTSTAITNSNNNTFSFNLL